MRHRGTDVGNFVLAEKADGKHFTDDYVEVLVRLPCVDSLTVPTRIGGSSPNQAVDGFAGTWVYI